MSAAEVLAHHQSESLGCCLPCGHQSHSRAEHAVHQLDALKSAGYGVIELPTVAHKGPHDTDAMFFRQVADRMADPTKSVNFLSGTNVRAAVRQLLYRAADATEQVGDES
jgi:hypothetical protein